MHVLILAAMLNELAPTLKQLGIQRNALSQMHHLHNLNATAEIIGIGHKRVIESLPNLLKVHCPDIILLLGVSGGLDPALTGGEVMIANKLTDASGHTIDLKYDPFVQYAIEHTNLPHNAHFFMANEIIATPAQKQFKHQQTGAHAVDMESYEVAQLAQQFGLPCIIMRGISDGPNDTLIKASLTWIKPDGKLNFGKIASYILTHPHHIPRLMKAGKMFGRSTQTMAAMTDTMLKKLGDNSGK
ncbi:hypothetical protein [Poriferisphaera sp. WC338]|uniref:phosphorylase family protein n=1 Tax=Poriferisphaera sp. WC338 TaxID=3425129 RepID=UPI003D81779B